MGSRCVSGLANASMAELVEFPSGTLGTALNLERSNVGIMILGEYTGIEQDDLVTATGRIVSVPVGDALIGRVVNAVGATGRRQGAAGNGSYPTGGTDRSRRSLSARRRYTCTDGH